MFLFHVFCLITRYCRHMDGGSFLPELASLVANIISVLLPHTFSWGSDEHDEFVLYTIQAILYQGYMVSLKAFIGDIRNTVSKIPTTDWQTNPLMHRDSMLGIAGRQLTDLIHSSAESCPSCRAFPYRYLILFFHLHDLCRFCSGWFFYFCFFSAPRESSLPSRHEENSAIYYKKDRACFQLIPHQHSLATPSQKWIPLPLNYHCPQSACEIV